jgi:lipoprotein NlpI
MSYSKSILLFLGFTALSVITGSGAEVLGEKEVVTRARTAFQNGKLAEALDLAGKLIETEPGNPQGYLIRAQIHEANRAHEKAIADYSQVLKLDPRAAQAYQRRGTEHFKAGQITNSIADFDKFIELVPREAPYHWQRGISLYYAGRYEDGRKQFESHQTVNSHDVENAVWHFLCVARSGGVEKARAALIPIEGDARVPMKEVHALFAGKAKPEDVLTAARAGEPSKVRLEQQLFYADLYLGLYFEVIANQELAREHILKAAERSKENDYMGDVARVHADALRRSTKK